MRPRIFASLAVAGVLSSCGGGGGDSSTVNSTPTSSLTSSVATVAVVAPYLLAGVQEVTTISAVVRDANGSALSSIPVTWQSSNQAVATVNQAGVVTALSEGTTRITASAGDKSGFVEMTVSWSTSDVDFAIAEATTSMSGLLHGLNFTGLSTPDDVLITPLAPAIWRGTPNVVPVPRAKGVGSRYTVILSDYWGYPVDGWRNGKPWIKVAEYEELVRATARSLKGSVDVWEIWNEPDPAFGTTFWDGTEQEFFETYLRAYKVLRAELGPDALIAGPSITRYDEEYLDRFTAFCIARGCQANVLSWHENGNTAPIQDIEGKLRRARARYLDASANGPLAVREIHIYEYLGPAQTYSPATSLLYMQYLERGGADAAARSCWIGSSGTSDCFNNSLDGLLTPTGFQPRSVWWANRLYAQGAAKRVASTVQRPQMLSLPSILASTGAVPSTALAQVLTGVANVDGAPAGVALGVRLAGMNSIPGLQNATSVRMQLFRVLPSGEDASPAPELLSEQMLSISQGKVGVHIPASTREAIYQLVLLPVQ